MLSVGVNHRLPTSGGVDMITKQYLQTVLAGETLQQIFAYIHPASVWRYRELCRSIHHALTDPRFARINLQLHMVGLGHPDCNTTSDNPLKPNIITHLDILDRLWWKMASPYHELYVKMKLDQLVRMDFSYTELYGRIPSSISHISNISSLCLNNNHLRGEIPDELGLLVNLVDLTLSRNEFTGRIPASFGALKRLKILGLCHNRLTGSLPVELSALVGLKYLSSSYNRLEGCIPVEYGNLVELNCLVLDSNRLSGHIPRSFGNLKSLQYLSLAENQFQGDLPEELSRLQNLAMLFLNENRFSESVIATVFGLGLPIRCVNLVNACGNNRAMICR